MNKKFLSLLLVLAMLFAFTGCSQQPTEKAEETTQQTVATTEQKTEATTVATTEQTTEATTAEATTAQEEVKLSGEVNLYTTRHYESDDAIFAKFEEKYGVKVNVNKDKAGALIEKIKAEGDSPQADLFITADAGNLAKAKTAGILEAVNSEVLDANIPAKYRDVDNNWFGLTKRARIMLYSTERVTADDLKDLDYAKLATDERWKEKLLVRPSNSIYNQSLVASFIEVLGEEKAAEWVNGIVGQMARTPEGNDRDQALAIKDGVGDIAISNSYYYGKLINNDKEKYEGVADVVGIYFPNQDANGVHVNISGVGLIKNSQNQAAAIKLMEFLSEVEQQETFSSANYEFPVNPVASADELLQGWLDAQGITELNEQNINLSVLGEHNAKALEIMTLAGWDN